MFYLLYVLRNLEFHYALLLEVLRNATNLSVPLLTYEGGRYSRTSKLQLHGDIGDHIDSFHLFEIIYALPYPCLLHYIMKFLHIDLSS